MRTYGAHGGEQQLSQYFSSDPRGAVAEAFAFVYRDPECARLFAARSPALEQIDLWDQPLRTGRGWAELLTLVPRLPILQARLFLLVRLRRMELVVAHGFQAALVVWPVALIFRRIRWVYVHRITKSKRGGNFLFRLLYMPFHAVAGNSCAVTASLVPFVSARRLFTLENGLDWRRFEARAVDDLVAPLPEAAGPVIVSVGRLLPHKGQALLIEAFGRLAGRHPGAALWIIGDGPEAESLRADVARSPAAARISMLGARSDVPAVLSLARIFAHASSWEGMSNAVLEGMAAGLPSVVADAPGVSECHQNDVTGMIVARNVEALTAGIDRLLADSDLCTRMGAAARARVRECYSIEANRRRYLELFGRMTGRKLCVES